MAHADQQEIVTLKDIIEARQRIQRIVPPTPMKESKYLQSLTGIRSFLKLENLNISGSFSVSAANSAGPICPRTIMQATGKAIE